MTEFTNILELKMNIVYHWNGHVQHCCTLDMSSWALMLVKGVRDSSYFTRFIHLVDLRLYNHKVKDKMIEFTLDVVFLRFQIFNLFNV